MIASLSIAAAALGLPGSPVPTSIGAVQHPQPYVTEWSGIQVVVVPDRRFGVTVMAHSLLRMATIAGEAFHPDSVQRWVLEARQLAQSLDRRARTAGRIAGLCGGWIALFADSVGLRLELRDRQGQGFSIRAPDASSVTVFLDALSALARASTVRSAADGTLIDDRGVIPSPRAGDSHVQIKSVPLLVFPPDLLKDGIQGVALLRYVVGADGRPERASIEVIWASHRLFGEAAIKAVRQAKYLAARINGKATRELVVQAVTFRIGG